MEVIEMEYENFGRCVRISNDKIECIVTIDVGPRIIHFGFLKDRNIFYTDLGRRYTRRCSEETSKPEKDTVYFLYGGHRLQVAQTQKTDFPDNAPVVYSVMPDSVLFTPPKTKKKEIQFSFEIFMGKEASDMMVLHRAKNCSQNTLIFGLYPSTLLKGNGIAILPQNTQGGQGSPNRTINLWENTDINDPRLQYGNRYLTIKQDLETEAPLRIGTNDLPGWIAYCTDGLLLTKRFVVNSQAAYPDSGSSAEARLTKDFCELSSLSPVFQVKPGETVKHAENLSLSICEDMPNVSNEEDIEMWVNKHVEID